MWQVYADYFVVSDQSAHDICSYRHSTFRWHELSLLLLSFSPCSPGTHGTHCSCDDQSTTISPSLTTNGDIVPLVCRQDSFLFPSNFRAGIKDSGFMAFQVVLETFFFLFLVVYSSGLASRGRGVSRFALSASNFSFLVC